jgi:hypothetical protein
VISNDAGVVRDWKKLTMLSGQLNPRQMDNLRKLPWLVIKAPRPEGLKIKVDYDLEVTFKEGQKAGHVTYDLTCDEEVLIDDPMLKVVDQALRTLFWEGLRVEFKFNGERFWRNDAGDGKK